MNITLRQLRAFLLVADTRHFTQAASAMHITQSALSALIRELEGRLTVQLFDRHTRMVELTEAGQHFYQVAENIFNDLHKGVNDLHEIATLQRGKIRIVASTVIASGLLSPCFKSFRMLYPNIQLSLQDVAEEVIAETVASGTVDFGIGTYFELNESLDLEEEHLFDDKFIALCSKTHPLAQRQTIAWADLQGQPFIALAPSSPIRKLIDQACQNQGIALHITNEVSFATTVLSLVNADMGVSILPMNNHPYVPAFDVHAAELVEPEVRRRISVLTRKNRSLMPSSSEFIRHLRQHLAQKSPQTLA